MIFHLPRSILAIFIYKMCERFSYFALRNNMYQYLVDANGFNINIVTATQIVTQISIYSLIGSLLISITSDIIGQKTSLIIGSIILLIGHAITHIQNMKIFIISWLLINIAGSFLRSSLIAILNKLCSKYTTENFELIITQFYQAFNFGVLIGQLTFGYIVYFFNWQVAFLYAFFIVLLGNIVGILLNKQAIIEYTETSSQQNNKQTTHDRYKTLLGVILYIMLYVNFIFYMMLESFDMHLLPGWLTNYGNQMLFSTFYITVSSILSLNPLLVIFLPTYVNKLKSKLQQNKILQGDFLWSNIAIVIMIIASWSLMIAHIEYHMYGISSIAGFVIYTMLLSIGEMCIFPTILASPVTYLPESVYGTALTIFPLTMIIGHKLGSYLAIYALTNINMLTINICITVAGIIVIIINIFMHHLYCKYHKIKNKIHNHDITKK